MTADRFIRINSNLLYNQQIWFQEVLHDAYMCDRMVLSNMFTPLSLELVNKRLHVEKDTLQMLLSLWTLKDRDVTPGYIIRTSLVI